MPFPTTEPRVAAAETALNVRLPSAWRDRLLRDNGGDLQLTGEIWQIFPVHDTSDRKRATRTASHIILETGGARAWPEFPPDGVPIAGNGSGDYLTLLPDPSHPGQLGPRVHRWDHETGQLEPVGLCETLGSPAP